MKAMIRWWCMSFRALTLLGISSAVAAGGCGTGSMTLAQELAWEQWNRCDKFPNVKMDRMEPDGRIWVKYHSAAEFREWNACVTEVRAEQGRRKVAVVLPAATAVPSSTPPVTASFSAGVAPLWRVGDEWAFRWEQPDGAGTF